MKRWCFGIFLGVLGCAEEVSLEEAEIFTVGDSIFDWHIRSSQDAPAVLGEEVGRSVFNAAVGGGTMTQMGGESYIPDQYVVGEWDWLIMDGGANDLNDACACGDCEDVMAAVQSSYTDFIADRMEEGVRVLIWGYYSLPPDASYGFDRCHESIRELSDFQESLAAANEGVYWVDGADRIGSEDLSAFASDRVHPSKQGSQMIAEQLAEVILSID